MGKAVARAVIDDIYAALAALPGGAHADLNGEAVRKAAADVSRHFFAARGGIGRVVIAVDIEGKAAEALQPVLVDTQLRRAVFHVAQQLLYDLVPVKKRGGGRRQKLFAKQDAKAARHKISQCGGKQDEQNGGEIGGSLPDAENDMHEKTSQNRKLRKQQNERNRYADKADRAEPFRGDALALLDKRDFMKAYGEGKQRKRQKKKSPADGIVFYVIHNYLSIADYLRFFPLIVARKQRENKRAGKSKKMWKSVSDTVIIAYKFTVFVRGGTTQNETTHSL